MTEAKDFQLSQQASPFFDVNGLIEKINKYLSHKETSNLFPTDHRVDYPRHSFFDKYKNKISEQIQTIPLFQKREYKLGLTNSSLYKSAEIIIETGQDNLKRNYPFKYHSILFIPKRTIQFKQGMLFKGDEIGLMTIILNDNLLYTTRTDNLSKKSRKIIPKTPFENQTDYAKAIIPNEWFLNERYKKN